MLKNMGTITIQELIMAGIPVAMFQPHPLNWEHETWHTCLSLAAYIKKSSPPWLYQKEDYDHPMLMAVLAYPIFSPPGSTLPGSTLPGYIPLNPTNVNPCGIITAPSSSGYYYVVVPLQLFSEGVWGKVRGYFEDYETAWQFAMAEYYRERLQNYEAGQKVCQREEFSSKIFKVFISPVHQCAEQGCDQWWINGQWNTKNHLKETLIETFKRVIFSYQPYENNQTASQSLTLLAEKMNITNITNPNLPKANIKTNIQQQANNIPWKELQDIGQRLAQLSHRYSANSLKVWHEAFAVRREFEFSLIAGRKYLIEQKTEKI